ncbi:sister chromatid cohesion protein PDS5 homolog B-like [Phyllopteryx taeniolatus]|uniref:sister chromatid cohesion protein PDS5 homolog B-like n=1 Tax=Phyllopteryx taeniolatus TaxID=161469 RepID=UPI002AD55F15|nr:sister chromatid cohesion protein PDS5 homolog B-like [Phyllopteryx taeniolatus]
MSVNASSHELIVLIFRYLKENGFHTAAEELLRHSPQSQCGTMGAENKLTVTPFQEFVEGATEFSSSLVEIYSSWLKYSKNKHSSSNGGGSTPIEAASKKDDKPAKKAQTQKSVKPQRERKDGKLSETVTKKLKEQQNAVAAGDGGGDSDSDSSLDVEKWRKMLVQMTEVDIAKIDTINALDPSIAKPVKKRVRKPQAKPKIDTSGKQPPEKSDVSEKAVTVEQTKSSPPKKTTMGTTAPVTPLNSTQQPISSEEGRTKLSSKETKKRGKKKVITPTGEQAEAPTPQHKKKKKKESSESEAGENRGINGGKGEEAVNSGSVGKPVEDVTNCIEPNSVSQDEQVVVNTIGNAEEVKRKEKKNKKKQKLNADSQNISETLIKDKKSQKKKKGDEGDEDRMVEPPAEDKESRRRKRTVDHVEVGEQVSQQENPDQKDDIREARKNMETPCHMEVPNANVREKKTKEKKRKSHPVEGTPQQVGNETKMKRKKDKAKPEEEQIVDENASVNIEEIAEANTEVKKKKKKKLGSIDTVPLFSLETPSPPSQKKKKKRKVDSDEFPATPSCEKHKEVL